MIIQRIPGTEFDEELNARGVLSPLDPRHPHHDIVVEAITTKGGTQGPIHIPE